METAQVKLELFRFIDTINENNLMQLYDSLIVEKNKEQDFWLKLSAWEKQDIETGIDDLNNGRKSDFFEFMRSVK